MLEVTHRLEDARDHDGVVEDPEPPHQLDDDLDDRGERVAAPADVVVRVDEDVVQQEHDKIEQPIQACIDADRGLEARAAQHGEDHLIA